ncbi:ceramidase [Flagelloscypha sp. PMI_526]|nr:ceramidase [Flagelloscypha sp. PMI_526]
MSMSSFERWKDGYFSPVTSTLDWCEANYQFSHYIAEMANTMSNLFTIGLALYAARLTQNEGLPTRFVVGHLLIALVGLGSFLFHATLTYEAQMGDELPVGAPPFNSTLPMIFSVTLSLWILFDSTKGFGNIVDNFGLPLALFSFDGVFAWSYQAVFAILLFTFAGRITYILGFSSLSSLIPKSLVSTVGRIFGMGAGLFALGFLIWNLDNVFCDTITDWKVRVGWPTAFLLEGHAWWHILTALGTYYMSIGAQFVALAVKDDYRKYTLVHTKGLPFVQSVHRERVD